MPKSLRARRDEVTSSFSDIALAYETLSDPKKRQMYDLTGEWGREKAYEAPPEPKTRGERMGDRQEAERIRRRQQVQKMDDIQRRMDMMELKAEMNKGCRCSVM